MAGTFLEHGLRHALLVGQVCHVHGGHVERLEQEGGRGSRGKRSWGDWHLYTAPDRLLCLLFLDFLDKGEEGALDGILIQQLLNCAISHVRLDFLPEHGELGTAAASGHTHDFAQSFVRNQRRVSNLLLDHLLLNGLRWRSLPWRAQDQCHQPQEPALRRTQQALERCGRPRGQVPRKQLPVLVRQTRPREQVPRRQLRRAGASYSTTGAG